MIRVSFEAENASALKQQLQEFLDVTASAPASAGEEGQQEQAAPQPAPADQKSKRGRPRKEQGSVTAEAGQASSPPPEAQTAVTDDPAITLDDLKALAVKVMDAGGGAQSVKLMAGSRTVAGFWLGHCFRRPEMIRGPLAELGKLVADGRLTPVLGGEYALSDVRQAHSDLLVRRTIGKLVLDPSR